MIKELDLHGVRHHEVDRKVENFVLLEEKPIRIITGIPVHSVSKIAL